jgi:phage shock protein C
LRLRSDRWIAGVCSGLARYWGIDPAIVRILFIALAICPVLPAIIPYIVCWIVIPQEPVTAPAAFMQQQRA